jgi:LmbE family N-acetylglucosaminyl deacetylase
MNVVVLAPHTDDETLACGGTIAKMIGAGHDVFIYAFSCGNATNQEFINACNTLGAACHPFHHFETRVFNECRQVILDSILEIRKLLNPEVVFVPARSDVHQDHQVVTQEGIRAFKHSTIYGYECPWNSLDFSNGCYSRLEKQHIDKKIKALTSYKSQGQKIYFREENIVSLARVRGMQANCEYAESFEVIRQII